MVLTEKAEFQPANTSDQYDRNSEIQAFDDTKAGVTGLAKTGVEKIPLMFVNEQYILEKKLNSSRREFSIPVIDLEGMNKDANALNEIIDKINEACEEWGFFQIVNHGVPIGLMDKVLESVKAFHELDVEVKKQYYARGLPKKVFYNSNFNLHQASSANWRDTLYLNMSPSPPEPEELPQVCRDTMMAYLKHVKKLGIDLFELMSEALGLHKNHLTLGLSTHTDSGFLTILLQDQIGGLQVLHKDQWVDVLFNPGALIVNIGDLMELITNAKFKSVYHRVLANKAGPRMSVAFFFRMHVQDQESSNSKVYGPIKELLSEENPPIYREVTGEEIVACRRNTSLDIPLLSHFKLHANSLNK